MRPRIDECEYNDGDDNSPTSPDDTDETVGHWKSLDLCCIECNLLHLCWRVWCRLLDEIKEKEAVVVQA